MGGSQLKQLKETLKARGLSGSQAKKSKTNKVEKSLKQQAMKAQDKSKVIGEIREQFNPFEIKFNRNKHTSIFGRLNTAGPVGKPGISKQIGEEQRKKAYEMERSRKHKIGGVMDRRFGEYDSNMTEEEKMLERYTKEKLSRHEKRTRYNLDDELEDGEDFDDGFTLTHGGQSLSFKDDFDEGDLGVEESEGEESEISRKRVRFPNENDSEETETTRKKTKAEVMKEVIMKSKFYKAQRQEMKEKDQDEMDLLDEDFEDVLDLLKANQDATSSKVPASVSEPSEKDATFNTMLKELQFEGRAQPTDRTKTDEELAKERAEKLEKLEQDRINRMNGIEDDYIEGDVEEVNKDDEYWVQSSEDEDNGPEPEMRLGEQREKPRNREEEESEDEEVLDDGMLEEQITQDRFMPSVHVTEPKSPKAQEVPYKFSCPGTYEQYFELVTAYKLQDEPLIVERILDCNSANLKPGNKQKIAKLTAILLQRVFYLADAKDSDNYDTRVSVINSHVSRIRRLMEKDINSKAVALAYRKIIDELRSRILNKTSKSASSTYPKRSDMLAFALVSQFYSTSDQFHLIGVPMMLLMGLHLELIPLTDVASLVSGVFLVETLLKYQRISKRFVPEVPMFFRRAFRALFALPANGVYLVGGNASKALLMSSTKFTDSLDISTLSLSDIYADKDDKLLAKYFVKLLTLITDYTDQIWTDKSAFIEIAAPLIADLESISRSVSGSVSDTVAKTLTSLKNATQQAQKMRKPLVLQEHRPMAIPTYEPKFEENYNVDKKSYDPNPERQEINKLKAELKKERKAALKDIRRDAKFLSRELIAEKRQKDAEYHQKMGRIFNTVATEEGAEKNRYEREKKARKGK